MRLEEVYSANSRFRFQSEDPAWKLGGIGFALAAAFNDQHPLFYAGIVGLVPLQFLIADESGFKSPVGRVRLPLTIEFFSPDQDIARVSLSHVFRRTALGRLNG